MSDASNETRAGDVTIRSARLARARLARIEREVDERAERMTELLGRLGTVLDELELSRSGGG